ncbi:P1 family peptidase [Dethiosulfatarculus sandiegensis]|uniref:Peptidase n=1 Tax=Dethiosulfatarculus sandiegensis TaxID=1429043 RepID=A0A0D2K0V8_9BACT|nr:P1 family peptidase [Dethiosulfatarculus sandiegensis]KIX15355.1 peptidase [Dethiosulfatarculus sandiegensis]
MQNIEFNGKGSPADVPGFLVGHAEHKEVPTGLSVVLCPQGALGGLAKAGYATGTRQMDGLEPDHMVDQVHGLLFTGGSSFGLNACEGVQKFLEERGHGLSAGPFCIPIVPAAVIFDLALARNKARPDAQMAYQACLSANDQVMKRGNQGAGKGATVGKFFGLEQACKSGLGGASLKMAQLKAGCLAVVNAFGDIMDERGNLICGARTSPKSCELASTELQYLNGSTRPAFGPPQNTTLAVITTNARLNKQEACKVARIAHHGMVRTVCPTHTTFDGDLVVVLTSGQVEADLNGLGVLFSCLVSMAILDGVRSAESWGDLPAASEIRPLSRN